MVPRLTLAAAAFSLLALGVAFIPTLQPGAALAADPTPGPPAQLRFLQPAPVPCGDNIQVWVQILDSAGFNIDDSPTVTFTTSYGQITPERLSNRALAVALFSAPKRPGSARITATIGSIRSEVTVQVVCVEPTATPTAAVPVVEQPPNPAVPSGSAAGSRPAGTISPPNTGDGGISRQ